MLYTCTYILPVDILVDIQLLYTHGHTQLHTYTCSNIHEYTHICTHICPCHIHPYAMHIYIGLYMQTPQHEYTHACMHAFSACIYVYVWTFYIMNVFPHMSIHIYHIHLFTETETYTTSCACSYTDAHIAHSLGMYTYHTLQLVLWQESNLAINYSLLCCLGQVTAFL